MPSHQKNPTAHHERDSLYLPGKLSPVAGNDFCARFDGGRLLSEGLRAVSPSRDREAARSCRATGRIVPGQCAFLRARTSVLRRHDRGALCSWRVTCGYEDCVDLDVAALRFGVQAGLMGSCHESGRDLILQPTLSRSRPSAVVVRRPWLRIGPVLDRSVLRALSTVFPNGVVLDIGADRCRNTAAKSPGDCSTPIIRASQALPTF